MGNTAKIKGTIINVYIVVNDVGDELIFEKFDEAVEFYSDCTEMPKEELIRFCWQGRWVHNGCMMYNDKMIKKDFEQLEEH